MNPETDMRRGLPYGLATSVGKGRANNQDAWLAYPDVGVFVVADGVGGGRDGDVASRAIISAIADEIRGNHAPDKERKRPLRDRIGDATGVAHQYLRSLQAGATSGQACASTFVALSFEETGTEGSAISVGDSRAYRCRKGRLARLTRDTVRWAWCGWRGVNAWPFRRILTRAIGAAAWPPPETRQFSACAGDVFLLCTDGLWGVIQAREMRRVLDRPVHPQSMADQLVAMALERGGRDNITCCVVKYAGPADSGDSGESDTTETPTTEGNVEMNLAGGEGPSVRPAGPAGAGLAGSVLVEFTLLLGLVVLPLLALLMAEVNGHGFGFLYALRDFCARILVVVGSPLL